MALETTWSPTNSQGVLPNKRYANAFRYRFFIDFLVPAQFLLPFQDLTANWKINIKDPAGRTIFEQEVKVYVGFISFGTTFLEFFVWFFRKEEIKTTIVNGQAITEENPAWKYTIGGTPTSEFGLMEKGGGSDYTAQFAIVEDWWDSTIYNMNIPVGSKLEIEFVRISSGGSAPNSPSFQFRFQYAQPNKPVILDRQGAVRHLNYVGNDTNILHSYEGPENRLYRASIPETDGPIALWKQGSTLWAIVAKSDLSSKTSYVIYYSYLEGLEWHPLLYTWKNLPPTADEELIGEPVALWQGKAWNLFGLNGIAQSSRGGVYAIAMLGDELYFQRAIDLIEGGSIRKVGNYTFGGDLVILASEKVSGKENVIITDTKDFQIESNDGGDTFFNFDGTEIT